MSEKMEDLDLSLCLALNNDITFGIDRTDFHFTVCGDKLIKRIVERNKALFDLLH